MCYDDGTTLEQSNGDVTWLVVREACVFHGDCVAVKDCGYVNEINSMFANIRLTFVLVPLEFHGLIVVTIRSCVKEARWLCKSMCLICYISTIKI